MKVVIFCGGFGTRMWPASRKSYPKQFFPLMGGKSFFQTTYQRFRKIFKPEDIFVSTEGKYVSYVVKQSPDLPKANIIAEPERKDNLAAVGLVTAILEKRYPGEVMLVSWSDHFIGDEPLFLKAMMMAGKYAEETKLIVSVNERPRTPTTQNEWVKMGEVVGNIDSFKVVKILETVKRPELEVAKKMLDSNNYLINTGYRAWRTDIMLSYFKKYQPEMYSGLEKIMEADGSNSQDEVINREYHKFVKDSVEFGIFVKLPDDRSVTIPVRFGWEDAGTWELFYRAVRINQNQNVVEGEAYTQFIDSSSNLVIGPKGKAIGVIGLSNVVIIDTPDGLLVSDMLQSGKTKELFGILEKEKPEYVD